MYSDYDDEGHYIRPTRVAETPAQKRAALERQKADLERQIRVRNERMALIARRAEETLEALRKVEAALKKLSAPQDVYAEGTVIKFDKRYGHNVYTFVAIKKNGRWYSSSIFQNRAMTWDEMIRTGDLTPNAGPFNIQVLYTEAPSF